MQCLVNIVIKNSRKNLLCFIFLLKIYFSVEPVEVQYPNGDVQVYPELSYREQIVDINNINTKIGFNLKSDEMVTLLEKMSLSCKVDEIDDTKIHVVVPPTRHDILHEW